MTAFLLWVIATGSMVVLLNDVPLAKWLNLTIAAAGSGLFAYLCMFLS